MVHQSILKIFIDTEFTDLKDPILIALGMVTDRGEELYFEVPFPEEKCTPFVQQTVLPLLGREPHAFIELDAACLQIHKWLEVVRRADEEVHICTDYRADWELFCTAIENRLPPWLRHRPLKSSEISKLLIYEFHKNTGLPEHHALYDARANKYAFRSSI